MPIVGSGAVWRPQALLLAFFYLVGCLAIRTTTSFGLAVLLKYEHFLAMQEKILKAEGQ